MAWIKAGVGLILWGIAYRLLQPAAEYLTYRLLGLTPTSHLGASAAFFLYEAPKVLLLLVVMIFGVGIVRSFFTAERTCRLLAGRRRELGGNVLAAGLGTVTSFCSCSAVPLFLGFVEVGVPLGVTFSLLIAAGGVVDEDTDPGHWLSQVPEAR